ncbi:MAG TPA: branched-chain amino acid ABC transporter permease [Candidatus Binatia bacterium]|jgi:branched-chain amino acid transport system permease protein|nr:branched-chain amino acid ABC transporter permease [Candidatus Binatia bacterium]
MLASLLIYGLINSVTLALTALGFSLVYGISRVANFAHGALYVLAGFLAWVFLNRLQLNYYIAVLLSLVVISLIGAAIYRFALIRVRGMPLLEIIVTFALGTATLESLRYFGFLGSNYGLPPLLRGSVNLLGVPVDLQRIVVVIVGVVLVFILWLFTHYTRTGLAFRAMAQDEQAAMMLGIDSDRMATLSLALGAALVGLAAAVVLPLGFIATESGGNILVSSIAVCILGGLESPAGVIVASLIIGYAQILTVAYLGPHYQMIVSLVAILVTLVLKPSGLFGKQKELEERV